MPGLPTPTQRIRRYALCAAVLLPLLGCGTTSGPREPYASLPDTAGESPTPCELNWRRAVTEARNRLEAGDVGGARESLFCASLLHPSSESLRDALEKAEQELYRKLLEESEELLSRGRRRLASDALARAATLSPDAGEPHTAARRLKQLGYRQYASRWIHRDEIKALERVQDRIATKRREELELGEEFTLDRRENVRIFTDLPREEALLRTRRLHVVVDALKRSYSELFFPVGLPERGEPPGGLDIVVFARRADYEGRTESPSTVGMFLPQYRASFFYLAGHSLDENVPVLLHESCHLLEDRLLGTERPPHWLQEGVAVYFEAAEVSPGGELRLPEGVSTSRQARLHDALVAGGDRWWGVRRLVERTTLSDLHGKDSIHDFYDQAGLLVTVLLEDQLLPREMFYRLVEKARAPAAGPETAWHDFQRVIEGYGETEETIDTALQAAIGTATR